MRLSPKMRNLHFIVLACLLSGACAFGKPFDFGAGTIDLPQATVDNPERGVDSRVGSLESSDGTPDIKYDIGLFIPDKSIPKISSYLQTGKIEGYDYFITADGAEVDFVMFRPALATFTAIASTSEERKKILHIYSLFTEYKSKKGGAGNPER